MARFSALLVGSLVPSLALACFTLGGCGSSSQPGSTSGSASQTLGPAGGQVTADRVSLTIPAGDLSSTTTIGIATDPAGPPSSYAALSPLYDFTPTGLTLATPGTVTITATTSAPGDSIYCSDGGGYEALPTTWAGDTATASITKLDDCFLGALRDGGASAEGGLAGPDATMGEGDAAGDGAAEAASDAVSDATLDATSAPPGVGASCLDQRTLQTIACQSPLLCVGGICVQIEQGAYCNNSDECDPLAGGCGGPYELECNLATNACECTCNCSSACSECAAPVAQLGQGCNQAPPIGSSTYEVACILSLSCVDGTCQPPGSDGGAEASVGTGGDASGDDSSAPSEASAPEASIPEASAPEASIPEASAPEASAPEASAPEASAPEASAPEGGSIDASALDAATDADAGPAALGARCVDPMTLQPIACQTGLSCVDGYCANTQPGTYCDNSDECDPTAFGCGGPQELECHLATNTCECTCNCDTVCSECAAAIQGQGQTCYASATLDTSTGNYYPTCTTSFACVGGICQ